MATELQIKQLTQKLKHYKRKYLRKQFMELDESATRIMTNALLTEVLGYKELEEIKTEYRIKSEYADYVIQVNRKKHFVVEVKSIQLDLNEKHLRQSTSYAANEGIDWIILTNGKQVELYKVIFAKPISTRKVFSFDLAVEADLKKVADFLIFLTKKSVAKNELYEFWKRFEALEPNQLSKNLYAAEVVRFLKRILKNKTKLNFKEEDILESIYKIITTKIESVKPKSPVKILKKKPIKNEAVPDAEVIKLS